MQEGARFNTENSHSARGHSQKPTHRHGYPRQAIAASKVIRSHLSICLSIYLLSSRLSPKLLMLRGLGSMVWLGRAMRASNRSGASQPRNCVQIRRAGETVSRIRRPERPDCESEHDSTRKTAIWHEDTRRKSPSPMGFHGKPARSARLIGRGDRSFLRSFAVSVMVRLWPKPGARSGEKLSLRRW